MIPATVLIDAGGVLVDPDWERVARIAAAGGLRVDAATLRASEPAARRAMDLPPTIAATDDRARGGTFFGGALRGAGVPDGHPALAGVLAAIDAEHARDNLWCVVPPGAREALDRLGEAGLRRVLVSNAPADLPAHLARIGLARRLDHLVVSGLCGFEKPDPRIFREALRAASAEAATSLHVGDFHAIDVLGARSAGIAAVLVDPGDIHGDRDCPRYPSFAACVEGILAGSALPDASPRRA